MGEPPVLTFPAEYNAAADFIDRHLADGSAGRIAVIDDQGSYSYGELAERVNRCGNLLRDCGLRPGERIAMLLLDGIDFPTVFWGALKAGFIPIPLNTLLSEQDYIYILEDSAASGVVISDALLEKLQPVINQVNTLRTIVISGERKQDYPLLSDLLPQASPHLNAATARPDDIAFWLYTSGSTGRPKGAMHKHSSLMYTAICYARGILGIGPEDRCFSAAKLFFAYGLGNGMTFPFSVGGTAILMAERPTPEHVLRVIEGQRPTLFFGVPSLYAAILADPAGPGRWNLRDRGLRACISAGEALPEAIGRACEATFGVPVLDGLGSTEMLHIFLSNSPAEIVYGSSGRPVPGYSVRLIDEAGADAGTDEIGELVVLGNSSATGYWQQPEKSGQVFRDGWTWTGDKYTRDAQGYYHYCGRADDMLKVSGQWVSPFEVEAALVQFPAIQEAAVVGAQDENGLVKPRAYVVLKPGFSADEALVASIQDFVKHRIAPHKYPRWIDFVPALPKTATGKIQRFRLRA
jgi:4-hydroxybenzoate-CoA ligase/benzoate-CoA ligase